ncbi:MAG: glycosyltransferase [Yoonia sp.]|uniref:glycosyltransferase n=1 Tax=Yoonia sp. TaxID=2212373 RepID=UPI003EF8DE31
MVHAKAVTNSKLNFYLPAFAGGGAERIFLRLANHFAERGHDVHFIVNTADGPLRGLLSDKVHLHVLGVSRAHRAVMRLAAYLRANDTPVLISAMTRTNLVALTAAKLARTNTKIIVCERNQYTTFSKGFRPLLRMVITGMVRWLYPTAAAVIGNTSEVTRDIAQVARLDDSKVGVINNPAPAIEQLVAARSAPADHPWLHDTKPVAVAIGRLVPQKDYETMLRAVALSGPDLRLIVLGTGSDHDALVVRADTLGIGDRVDFVGFQMDRFAYLVAADIFLISSVTEGFPNALIEAVAAGIPCVSTDCAGGGAQEIMGDDLKDWIVPVGDADAMADVIKTILASHGNNEATGKIDLSRIANRAGRFHIDTIADAFLQRVKST